MILAPHLPPSSPVLSHTSGVFLLVPNSNPVPFPSKSLRVWIEFVLQLSTIDSLNQLISHQPGLLLFLKIVSHNLSESSAIGCLNWQI